MKHPFDELKDDYAAIITGARVVSRYTQQIIAAASSIIRNRSHYQRITDATGVPIVIVGAIHFRESSFDWNKSLAQGDPWNRVSTHVPSGRGPFSSWDEAAIDAVKIDGLHHVKDWTWERACYEWELYNGFGYRNHGCRSAYVFAGLGVYGGGHYVADGKFSAKAFDGRPGCLAIAQAVTDADETMDLPRETAGSPSPAPFEEHAILFVQRKLNELGIANPHLVEDGIMGRRTKAAIKEFQMADGLDIDGVAGPKTLAKLRGDS